MKQNLQVPTHYERESKASLTPSHCLCKNEKFFLPSIYDAVDPHRLSNETPHHLQGYETQLLEVTFVRFALPLDLLNGVLSVIPQNDKLFLATSSKVLNGLPFLPITLQFISQRQFLVFSKCSKTYGTCSAYPCHTVTR